MILAVGLSGGCGKKAAKTKGALAIVDGVAITAADVEAEIARLPAAAREQYRSPNARRDLLASIVRTRVLLSEARRRGYDKDPAYQRQAEQQLIGFLMERALGDDATPADVPDAEAERYYKEHAAEFTLGERVRASEILVKEAPHARELLKQARALRKDDAAAFAALSAHHSVPAPYRMSNGDLGVLQREFSPHPAAVVAAAFALAQPGDISDVVAAPDGFHIVRLTERVPQQARPFAEVKAGIKHRLFTERRMNAGPKLVEDSRARFKAQLFEDEIAKAFPPAGGPLATSPTTPTTTPSR